MSVHIKTRKVASGEKRYLVYFRRGGRTFKMQYAGSFEKKRDAETRRGLIVGELAAGRDPKILLATLLRPESRVGLEQRWDEFVASRIDVGGSALGLYGNAKARWLPILGKSTDPHTVTVEQIQAGILDGLKDLQPNTIVHYASTLRQVLDFADVVPNPARSPKLRLPSQSKDEVNPPTTKEWLAILRKLAARSELCLRLIECDGLRVSEATGLVYGDVDFAEGRIRIARERTKTASGRRWLDVPDALLDEIASLCAPDDRAASRRVFSVSSDQLRYDLRCACRDAQVAQHGPHDLRHRRVSLWLRHGFDPVTVAQWAGHARSSMSLDVYGHVVLDPREDEWRDFWTAVYDKTRSPGGAPVGHQEALPT